MKPVTYFKHPTLGTKFHQQLAAWYGPNWQVLAAADGFEEVREVELHKHCRYTANKLRDAGLVEMLQGDVSAEDLLKVFRAIARHTKSNQYLATDLADIANEIINQLHERVLLVDDSGDVFDWVAEWCNVLDKVENRIFNV